MNATQERALCWMQGLKQAIDDKNREKAKKTSVAVELEQTPIESIQRGDTIEFNEKLHLVEKIDINRSVYTLFLIHRSRRFARTYFAGEFVMRKVS